MPPVLMSFSVSSTSGVHPASFQNKRDSKKKLDILCLTYRSSQIHI